MGDVPWCGLPSPLREGLQYPSAPRADDEVAPPPPPPPPSAIENLSKVLERESDVMDDEGPAPEAPAEWSVDECASLARPRRPAKPRPFRGTRDGRRG